MAPGKPAGAVTAPGLLRRIAAIVYDTFLVLPLIMVAVATGLAIRMVLVHPSAQNAALPPLVVQAIAAVVVVAFFSYFWQRPQGQTLGMQAWRIRIVSETGAVITLRQSVLRCLGALLSAACLGAGYWWCLFDRDRRCWHDRISRTRLELLPGRKGKKR